jgi:uncharacterized protein YecT (DUF1311 family)
MWLVAVTWAGTPEYEQCGAAATLTWDLVRCDEEETERLEKQLAEIQTRLVQANPARQVPLQKAHQSWSTFRDTRCSPPSDEEIEAGMARHAAQRREGCRLEDTQRRVALLEGHGARPEPEYQRCQQAGGSAQALLDCVGMAHQREDKRLNDVYGQVMGSSLAQAEKDWVKATERAWIPYRDATCAEEAQAQGGGAMAPARCALRMTTEQADWLELQLPK